MTRLDWPRAAVLSVALLLVVLVGFTRNTELISVGQGLGFDGAHYARLTTALREGTQTEPYRPFAQRVLPAAVVAVTGVDVRLGFLILDVLSYFGAVLLLLLLLRDHGIPPARAALAAGWFILLPQGLRLSLHYPVLTDAPAMLLVVALLLALFRRRMVAFAVLLALGVATRESLLLFVPAVALVLARELPAARAVALAAIASAPALAIVALLQLAPPVQPAPASPASPVYLSHQLFRIATNLDATAWRTVVAPLFALGAFLIPIVARPRDTWRYIRERPGWTYLIGTMIVVSVIGGRDTDRYLLMLAPIAAILAFAAAPAGAWPGGWRVAALTAIHLLMVRAWVPWGADATLSFAVGFMDQRALVGWTLYLLVLLVAGVLLVRSERLPA